MTAVAFIIAKLLASWIPTYERWFHWHEVSFSCKEKASASITCKGLYVFCQFHINILAHYIVTKRTTSISIFYMDNCRFFAYFLPNVTAECFVVYRFHLLTKVIEPTFEGQGRTAYHDVIQQIGDAIAGLEREYFQKGLAG